MSQLTLYLDEATLALVDRAAQACGVSKSRRVANLIRQHAVNEWPPQCLALAGRFPDFPLRDEQALSTASDVTRAEL